MRKNKFFVALSCLGLLFGLVACGGGNGESKADSNHKHSYGEWTITKQPTCEEKGQKEQVCSCGDKKTQAIDALGHDWDEGRVTKQATCSQPGEKLFTCKREGCGKTKTEVIKADHVWGEKETVVAPAEDKGNASYDKSLCTVCNEFYRLEIAANQAKVVTGGLKNDSKFPDYLKLNANGDSVELTFNYNAPATGEIYFRGVMDYWKDGNNENQDREGFYAGKSSSDGNFELKVNDAVVDYSWSKGMKYSDMFPEEAQDGNYSQLADVKVGAVNLVAGANVLTYKRTESYNLLIKDFVIIVKNTGDIVEPPVVEEGYDITFTHEHCEVLVFEEGQDYSVAPVKTDKTVSRDEEGKITKWIEPEETDTLEPQVNFKVVCDEGYEVDADCLTITGEYNKIKIVSNDAEENSWIIRITKIKSDLTIAVVAKEKVEGAVDGFEVTFALENCTVKVYVGPKDETGSNVDTAEAYYTRSKTDPYGYTKSEGQINFEIIPNSGFEFKDGIEWPVEKPEVSSSVVSFIAPSANYNKLKLNANGTYTLTKVTGALTITISATAIGE